MRSHRDLLEALRGGDAPYVARSIEAHVSGPGAEIVAKMTELESRGAGEPDAGDESKEGAHR